MSDNLIAKLRAVDHLSVEDCFLQSHLFEQAADRITALEAELATLRKRAEAEGFWLGKTTEKEVKP